MKKVSSLLICVCVFSVMQLTAQTFTFNPTTGYIIGLDPSSSTVTSVIIPDEIDGVKVKGIAHDAFSQKTSITSLTFNTTALDSIGMRAFQGCTGIASITIPSTVTKIGNWSFQHCSGVNQITFTAPSSLSIIGMGSFEGMTSLPILELPNSITTIGSYAFFNNVNMTQLVLPSRLKAIPDGMCKNCPNLLQIAIPLEVTSIGNFSFQLNKKLSELILPESVRTIGSFAFKECISLSNVKLNEGLSSILHCAFQYCHGLSSIEIPASVTTIEEYAFDAATTLETLTFRTPSNLKRINRCTFATTKLAAVSIPNSVNFIGEYAFGNCGSLSSVSFETNSNLAIIDKFAFKDNPQLKTVTLPTSTNLKIRQGAFEHTGLKDIVIPENVDSIGDFAFYNSAAFDSVRILRSSSPLTKLGTTPFLQTSSDLKIYVPASVLNDYKATENWSVYATQIFEDQTTDINTNREQHTMYIYKNNTNDVVLKGCEGSQMAVLNTLGQSVYQTTVISDMAIISLKDYPGGTYLIIVKKPGVHKIFKFIN